MIRRIFRLGSKELREVAKPVSEIDDELRELVKDMFETMTDAKGVGLAATQVGIPKRLFVLEIENRPMVFINPRIIKAVGKEPAEEGCLSLPGLRENVTRAHIVVAEATDLSGKQFKVNAEGLFARAIQHELDHLEGILFIDRISKARKLQIKRQLERIEAGLSASEENELSEDSCEE